MSLKNLASYLGTSAESLSRYFRDFEAKGWIERHRRKIIIKPALGRSLSRPYAYDIILIAIYILNVDIN